MHATTNILLVEDNELDVELIKRFFTKHGIKNTIYHALNGVEALEMLYGINNKLKIPEPFIVLIDINMPKMNGLELLESIRNDNSLQKHNVYMLSTSNRKADIHTAYRLNATGYYLKKDILKLVDTLEGVKYSCQVRLASAV